MLLLDRRKTGTDPIHAETGEIVSAAKPFRTLADRIKLYKSLGLAMLNAVAASLILNEAAKRKVVTAV